MKDATLLTCNRKKKREKSNIQNCIMIVTAQEQQILKHNNSYANTEL